MLHTWQSAVVSDEAGHVYVLVVDAQVLHASHELLVANGEVLREFGDSSEEQGAGEVQRSEKNKKNSLMFTQISTTPPKRTDSIKLGKKEKKKRIKNSSQR